MDSSNPALLQMFASEESGRSASMVILRPPAILQTDSKLIESHFRDRMAAANGIRAFFRHPVTQCKSGHLLITALAPRSPIAGP
jgi:hypothetical protein